MSAPAPLSVTASVGGPISRLASKTSRAETSADRKAASLSAWAIRRIARDGMPAADTTSSGTLCRCASSVAHSAARVDSSDPSTPTTTGFAAMVTPLGIPGGAYSWLPTRTARSARRAV
jgi:hypothetical protein